MAGERLAAVFFIILAGALTAQNTSKGRVVLKVVDQSGAVISGARIGIVKLSSVIPDGDDWLHFAQSAPEQASANTDSNGNATIALSKGSYAIAITARGFEHHFEKIKIQDDWSQSVRAVLVINPRDYCTLCVTIEPVIPLEYMPLSVFIPQQTLETIPMNTGRVRRR